MVAYAYDTVQRRNPVGFFGMVYVLEGTSVALALSAADASRQRSHCRTGVHLSAQPRRARPGACAATSRRSSTGLADAEDRAAVLECARACTGSTATYSAASTAGGLRRCRCRQESVMNLARFQGPDHRRRRRDRSAIAGHCSHGAACCSTGPGRRSRDPAPRRRRPAGRDTPHGPRARRIASACVAGRGHLARRHQHAESTTPASNTSRCTTTGRPQIELALAVNVHVPMHLSIELLPHSRQPEAASSTWVRCSAHRVSRPTRRTRPPSSPCAVSPRHCAANSPADTTVQRVHYLAPRATRTQRSTPLLSTR